MARRHSKEGGNHLEQVSYRQKTMEGTDGGLHPQWMGKASVKVGKVNFNDNNNNSRIQRRNSRFLQSPH